MRLPFHPSLASRMARSVWKGPFADPLEPVAVKGPRGSTLTELRGTRRSMILPEWVALKIQVHSGKAWVPVMIKEEMIGHRLGEFVATRRYTMKKKEDPLALLRAKKKKAT